MMHAKRVGQRTWGRRMRTAAWSVMAAAVLIMTIAGCEGQQRVEDADGEPVTFAEVRESYNERTGRVEQMWARSVVELRWEDEDGDSHFEQGDGPLIVRMPNELALALGKLGNAMYWVGGDAERFWFFDLNPPNGEPRTAIVGEHDAVSLAGSEEVPVPVRSDQVLHLLGLAEMPAPPTGGEGRVTRAGDALVVTIEAETAGEQAAWWRFELDPSNYLPRRIALLDGEGEPVVASDLERYRPLERDETPPGGWPDVATRIEITTPATQRASLTLFLEDPTDGKARDRVRDAQFDFEQLVEMLGPDEVRELQAEDVAAE